MDNNIVNENKTENTNESNNELKRLDLYKFVEAYNKLSSTKAKEEFLKAKVKVVSYIGYGTKMFLAQTIVENTCLNGNNVYLDSCKRYIIYIYTLIKYWTNLGIEEKDLLIQYDLLDENGLVEKIIKLIPEKEVTTFKTILEMKQNDLIENKRNVQSYINDKLKEIYPKISEAIMPIIDNMDKKINQMDLSEIAEKAIEIINEWSNTPETKSNNITNIMDFINNK